MKKRLLLIPIFIIILVFLVMPLGVLNADPGNLVKNGDFSDGTNNWIFMVSSLVGGEALVGPSGGSYVFQTDIDTSNKKLIYSVDVKPVTYGLGDQFNVYYALEKDNVTIGQSGFSYNTFPIGTYSHISFSLQDAWLGSLPDFDKVEIWLDIQQGCQVYCDNFSLRAPGSDSAEPVWVRTMPMTCYQVWINEDNMFEFIFWYPYKDNNWVRIYDMEGNMVYEVDMPINDPHIIVDLPDGMYTVKTFHEAGKIIQEFVIGKP